MQRRVKQKQRAWKLEIEAKANDLAFGLKATRVCPPPATARNLFRFSLRLKLSSAVIHVKSKYRHSIWPPNPLKCFKSKFVAKFSDKFRRRTTPAAARTTLNIPPPPRWKAMTIIKGSGWTGPIRYVASSVFKKNVGFGRKLSILLVLLLLVAVAFVFSPSSSLRCAYHLLWCVRDRGHIQSPVTGNKVLFHLNKCSFPVEQN